MTETSPGTPADDRVALAVAASLLEQGRVIDGVSRIVTALAVVSTPLLALGISPLASVPMLIIVALGLLQSWLAVRVGFDAALFGRLADDEGISPEAFDGVMTSLGLLPPHKAGRSWSVRIGGARRLMLWQGIAMMAQAGGSLGATLLMVRLLR